MIVEVKLQVLISYTDMSLHYFACAWLVLQWIGLWNLWQTAERKKIKKHAEY